MIHQKTVKVSAQRHLVIPKQFYDALGMQDEVTVELHDGHLVIKPVVKVDEDFAENLLEELLIAGYTGDALVAKFKEVKQKILRGEQVEIEEVQ